MHANKSVPWDFQDDMSIVRDLSNKKQNPLKTFSTRLFNAQVMLPVCPLDYRKLTILTH